VLGPGLLESVYETRLIHEFKKRGINFARQVALPVVHDGLRLEAALKLDLLVDDRVVVEIKTVEKYSGSRSAASDTSEILRKAIGIPHQFQCSTKQGRDPKDHPFRVDIAITLSPFASSRLSG